MRSLRCPRKHGLALAYVLASIYLCASPARAAVDVDLNGDGVIDRVVVQHQPDRIIVCMSGAQPQVLKVHGRILSIVATDINHDGRVDITAVSERRGLLVWLNGGSRGHFKAVTRRVRPHALVWSRRGGSASRKNADDDDGHQANINTFQELAGVDGFCNCDVPPVSHRVVLPIQIGLSADYVVASPSRAPPVPTF
jgi:hypothetical protein